MKVTSNGWQSYVDKARRINDEAGRLMESWIQKNGTSDRNAVIKYAMALIEKYGEASGALACEVYEAQATAQKATIRSAEMVELPSYGEVARTVNGALKQGEGQVPRAVSRQVKQIGADTTLYNALRDKAQFAWVPMGDTCAFCLTLASRGWQNMSKKALKNGHAEHIHANCDCQYAVRFDGKSTVEGYDPDKYLAMYKNAEGSTPDEKINSMRRKANGTYKKQILRLAKDGDIFVIRSEKLQNYAKNIKPINNFRDYVCHGDPYSLVFKDANGKESNVSAKEFCDILEKSGEYHGENIRLMACQTAAGDAIVPKYIARRFNIEVMAPTEIVNVDFDGNYILADDPEDAKMGIETGRWIRFNKDGEIK